MSHSFTETLNTANCWFRQLNSVFQKMLLVPLNKKILSGLQMDILK